MNEQERTYSVKQAAQWLNVTRATIYQMLKDGRLAPDYEVPRGRYKWKFFLESTLSAAKSEIQAYPRKKCKKSIHF